ncbi:hypothetical protein B0H17DRAFT_1200250 [Mycena rosella]|uniref:Uncharacterized protein n=1 Tax=Mycena rosella TaxID=1033263 RepID=A0AAD7DLG3_MYCRO|nr:hypothetical protein B0H17DRAFT_1200250 [Mycena rosella]
MAHLHLGPNTLANFNGRNVLPPPSSVLEAHPLHGACTTRSPDPQTEYYSHCDVQTPAVLHHPQEAAKLGTVTQGHDDSDDPDDQGPMVHVHGHWHRSPLIDGPWSCDWAHWNGIYVFESGEAEADLNIGFGIPGTIEPVAHLAWSYDYWFFAAAGRHYYYHEERDVVLRFEKVCESHDEFWRWMRGQHWASVTVEIKRQTPYGFNKQSKKWEECSSASIDHEFIR